MEKLGGLPRNACVAPTRKAVMMMHVIVGECEGHDVTQAIRASRPGQSKVRKVHKELIKTSANRARELRGRLLVNKITMRCGAP